MIYRGDYGRCSCGAKLSASRGADEGGPVPGDAIVCLYCEAFLILDGEGKARPALQDEVSLTHYATRRYIRQMKYKQAAVEQRTARHFNN